MTNLNDTPSAGPLTVDELHTYLRQHHTYTVPLAPSGCDQQGRIETRAWGVSRYGSDDMKPMPRIVPCSTVARWWLAIKRWLG